MKTTTTMLLVLCLILPALVCRAAVTPQVMVNDAGLWYRADVRVTEADFGKTVPAKVGDWVDVSVAENPSTGYNWHRSWAPYAGLCEIRSLFAERQLPHVDGPEVVMVGVGGTRHFLLYVSGVGKTTFTAQYGQWWQGGQRESPRSFVIDAVAGGPRALGEPVTVKLGSTYEIVRPANVTTGYRWTCTWEPTEGLKLTRNEYVPKPHPEGMVGVGGTQYCSLKAEKVGYYVVRLEYARGKESGKQEVLVLDVVP